MQHLPGRRERRRPDRLPAWNRGHWMVESAIRHARARHAPVNNIALAIVRHRGFRHVPHATTHFTMHRSDALGAMLSPD